jgi:hypothetical protein
MTETSEASYDAVVAAFAGDRAVSRETKRGFGSGALKVKGKIFAMLTPKSDFVVKLPKARVDELVRARVGRRFEPGPGRVMKEWLVVDAGAERASWIDLAKEAYRFVRGKA